jgi:GDPmannose 4,6-dehydratase
MDCITLAAARVFSKFGINIYWSVIGINEIGKDQSGNIIVRIDPAYFRPTEVPFLLGDATKARNLLGWVPSYTVESLIDEMVASEREYL